jgi:hypothetical protein
MVTRQSALIIMKFLGAATCLAVAIGRLVWPSPYLPDDPRSQPPFTVIFTAFLVIIAVGALLSGVRDARGRR